MSNLRKPRLFVEPLEGREVPATAVIYGSNLVIDGTDRSDSLIVRIENNRLTVDGISIRDGRSYSSSIDPSRVRQVVVHARGGDDSINLSAVKVPTMVWGGTGNDRIYTGSGDDTIYGDQGNDTIYGGMGNDWLVGGDGNDEIWGAAGNDWITGDNGDDRISGDSGNDSLSGGEGRDSLGGGAGADEFDGHGFGMGRADSSKNFDSYTDEFDLWRPIATTNALPPFRKGEIDDPGYLASLESLGPTDVKAAICVVSKGQYDVYLAGDRRTIRVAFDGTWNDNDPIPATDQAPAFATILLNRARLISFGIDPTRYYSNADMDALNAKSNGRLYSATDALRQFTGRSVSTWVPSNVDFATLKSRLDHGAAAVAYSYRASARTPNSGGVLGDTTYMIHRLFTDSRGKQWIELCNPLGTDAGDGRLLDKSPGAVQQNDGVITIAWDDFRRSSNFTTLYVA